MTQNLKTPCFLLDEKELYKGIEDFSTALDKRFRHARVGYSVKTNSLPYALVKAKEYGCVAEVVSDDELELALACGYELKDIVFNGPMKSKARFLEAVQAGATVNIETHREIDWLKDLPAGNVYNIGIRLSVNISDVSPEDADDDNDFSRFGFCEKSGEFARAIEAIKGIPQVRLAGLHIHRTSHSRSIRFYRNSVKYAASIIWKYNLGLDYLDIGGGFFGIFRNAPTFDDYAEAIHSSLKEQGLEHLKIIVEPGNALVASAFSYYSSVIDVKQRVDSIEDIEFIESSKDAVYRILTTDGTRNDIDPFFRKTAYMTDIARRKSCGEIVPLQIIAGATCLEYDQLFRLEDQEELSVGDIIKYKNVGAYTLTLTPMFINYLPRVYALGDDGLKLVRDKWTARELMQKSIL